MMREFPPGTCNMMSKLVGIIHKNLVRRAELFVVHPGVDMGSPSYHRIFLTPLRSKGDVENN